jgi:hypothetical protein
MITGSSTQLKLLIQTRVDMEDKIHIKNLVINRMQENQPKDLKIGRTDNHIHRQCGRNLLDKVKEWGASPTFLNPDLMEKANKG